MRLRLVDISKRERAYRLRMPFRFGVTTATHGRQAIVKARIRLEDGREETGYAAEALGAKWFDKNLSLSDTDNHHQLRKSLELATDAYLSSGLATAFALYSDHCEALVSACGRLELNSLVAGFGQSLLDRAVLDALCRAAGVSFYHAVKTNLFGMCPHSIAPELDDFDFVSFLSRLHPASSIDVRHTVGLSDPIVAADLPADARVDDGLPETLEEVVAVYRNRYFKIKVGGDDSADLDRLIMIASVLDRSESRYFVTLDGNEQYADAQAIAGFLGKVMEDKRLARLSRAILYVEQPIKRNEALARSVTPLATMAPVIIDESDGEVSAFAVARELGYTGVSSKSCKGLYKSIINLSRCRIWNEHGAERYFMSAEDLTCEPGVAIQQDLALANILGLTHVERNAHHYIDGFDGRPVAEARAFQNAHGDLYGEVAGKVRLRIEAGKFAIASLDCPGFAAAAEPDLAATEPMPTARWPRTAGGGR